MSDVFDYAKYFIKLGLDTNRNTFDGNMKLQKLLVLANLISLAMHRKPLFDDEILAFTYGCVVEKVRIRYKNDCMGFVADSEKFNPTFSQEEYDVLKLTASIFGRLSARELSDINHAFEFWSKAYHSSTQVGGYKDKSKAIVSTDSMNKEVDKILQVIRAFQDTVNENESKEIINSIMFYYNPSNVPLTDDILDELFIFSLTAEESAYSIYLDDGSLVIY